MRKTKVALTALLATTAVVSCAAASQTGASAASARTETAHIVVWSVNSDGPRFQAILTGAIGDYGPAVTVTPDGAVDPDHTSELELKLSHGSFRLSIAKLDAEFARSAPHWPYDRATCSVHATVTGTAPIVAGSGTGSYRGIAGSFSLTIGVDEDDTTGPQCSEETAFKAQLLLIAGTGSLRG
jgi:hypothetical protein